MRTILATIPIALAMGCNPDDSCDPTTASIDVPELVADPPMAHTTIEPSALDPLTDRYPQASHEVYLPTDPDAARRPQLFLILPGTSNHPSAFDRIAAIAVQAGYPVLGLAYDSEMSADEYCTNLTVPEEIASCRTEVDVEKIYGTDVTAVIDIDEPDSIVGRAVRVLARIDQDYPDAGVDAYYDGNTLVWENIVLVGFSQGAALAGYLSKDHDFHRVVFFAGGCDAFTEQDGTVTVLPWCAEQRATPASATFALAHTDDEFEEDTAIHAAFGLDAYGDYADAATESPGYCTNTHLLKTDLPSHDSGGDSFHLSVAHDDYMPLDDDGVPVLAEDYYYLIGGGE